MQPIDVVELPEAMLNRLRLGQSLRNHIIATSALHYVPIM